MTPVCEERGGPPRLGARGTVRGRGGQVPIRVPIAARGHTGETRAAYSCITLPCCGAEHGAMVGRGGEMETSGKGSRRAVPLWLRNLGT